MKRASRAASSLSLAALDGAIVVEMLANGTEAQPLVGLIALHAIVACASGVLLRDAAPSFVRASPRSVGLFVALVSFFVPVVAPVGMTAAFLVGFTAPRSKNQEPWIVFEPEPDDERHVTRRKRNVSAAEISAALRQRTAQTAEFRFQAVLAIKQLPPRVGVTLLKLAQSDPSDEVRLYAFSRLERMRDDLETQIKKLSASLSDADKGESARVHLRLAECYWELGYLGLAEGAVLEHALRSAHKHAATASELLPQHAPAEFFLGRILVQLRDAERATIAFERAIAAGYPRVRLLPYLAECSFQRRDFAGVRGLLRELDSSSPENLFFRPVMEFWQEQHAGPVPPPPGSRKSLSMKAVRP
jgi:polysaccharide biosynthesis protein PelE